MILSGGEGIVTGSLLQMNLFDDRVSVETHLQRHQRLSHNLDYE